MTAKAVQPIRPAATVIIARDGNRELELFMLRRTNQAAFAGGMYVFPGGKVESDDHLHSLDPWRAGPTEAQANQLAALGNEWRGFWIAAIRETFEESGLLLAYDQQGQLVTWDDPDTAARFHAYRDQIYRSEIDLQTLCEREQLRLACDHVHFFNRWVTPVGRPRRFDTRFFIAEAPVGQDGLHDENETVHSTWISPSEAIERYEADDFGLMRVTAQQLKDLQQFSSVAELHHWSLQRDRFPIYRPVLPPGA